MSLLHRSSHSGTTWAPDRIDYFGIDMNNACYHTWWDKNGWNEGEDLGRELGDKGVKLNSGISSVSWGPNRIDIFVLGTNHSCWHKWWDGKSWSVWENLGGELTSKITCCSWGANRLDLFALGAKNHCYHKQFDENGWSGWEPLDKVFTSTSEITPVFTSEITPVCWGPNRIDVFGLGTENQCLHNWYEDKSWGGWENLKGPISSPISAVSWGANRLDLFALGLDNQCRHNWWGEKGWGGWEDLVEGTFTSMPVAVSWGSGRLDIFAVGTDNLMNHLWYEKEWGSHWEKPGKDGPDKLKKFNSAPLVLSWAPGRLDIFGLNDVATTTHMWYKSGWGNWEDQGKTSVVCGS